jgi:hypothetical protein
MGSSDTALRQCREAQALILKLRAQLLAAEVARAGGKITPGQGANTGITTIDLPGETPPRTYWPTTLTAGMAEELEAALQRRRAELEHRRKSIRPFLEP